MSDARASRIWSWAMFDALLLVAIVTRVWGFSAWDIAYDEYFTVFEAGERMHRLINPAYYALVELSYALFGGVGAAAARLPALLFGIAGVPVLYLTLRRLAGSSVALAATALLVFSAWHVWYSQFARFYSAVFLFGALTYFLYYQAVLRDRLLLLALALAAGAVAAAFHATAILANAGCAAFSIVVVLANRAAGGGYSRRVALWHLALCLVALLAVLPTIWQVAVQWQGLRQFWGYGPAGAVAQLVKWIGLPVIVSAAAGVVLLVKRERGLGTFVTVAAGVPIALYVAGAAVTTVRPEYVFYCLPLVLLAAGYFCVYAMRPSGSGTRNSRTYAFLVTSVVAACMLPEFVSHYTGRAGLHLRQPAAAVADVFRDGDRVLPLINLYNAFTYYSPVTLPSEPVLGDPLDANVDWDAALAPYAAVDGCVWLVLPIRRQALAPSLERWLVAHAVGVWRHTSSRFDYKVEGYQIYAAGADVEACRARALARLYPSGSASASP